MTAFHLALHIASGLFILAGVGFAAAAVTFHNKGWQTDAFECVMWATACAFVTVLIW